MTEGSRVQERKRGVWEMGSRRLLAAQVASIIVGVLAVALYFLSLPVYYHQRLILSESVTGADPAAVRASLAEAGLSVGFYATYGVITQTVFAAVCVGLGALIFWRRPGDPMALLVALTLVLMIVSGSPPVGVLGATHPRFELANDAFSLLSAACLFLVFYLFPDGRFVPRWTRWLALTLIAIGVPTAYFPGSPLDWRRGPPGLAYPSTSACWAAAWRHRFTATVGCPRHRSGDRLSG